MKKLLRYLCLLKNYIQLIFFIINIQNSNSCEEIHCMENNFKYTGGIMDFISFEFMSFFCFLFNSPVAKIRRQI